MALIAADYPGLKPTMLVQPGERVLRGQPLFEDKRTPGVRYTAPAAGTVAAIHRGDMRAFQSLVIDVDRPTTVPTRRSRSPLIAARPVDALDADGVRALLVESGLWTAFRTRPFSKVPAPADDAARDLRHRDRHAAARARRSTWCSPAARRISTPGVRCVARLCAGHDLRVQGGGLGRDGAGRGARRASRSSPGRIRPARPGLHIHLLDPVRLEKTVWHIGYQDVIAIGRLVTTGRLDVERVISLAGPGAARPRLLRTRLGASTDELTRGELQPGEQRVISGSVLDGRTARGDVHGYLGRYHLQVSVLPEGGERELFGWIAPGARQVLDLGRGARALGARRASCALTTTTNGSPRAMVPIGAYERVMPMDLMPTFLLRALITGNVEWAEELGCLELDEEDLALCTFVCPGKYEYGPLLREMLTRIEKEHGA